MRQFSSPTRHPRCSLSLPRVVPLLGLGLRLAVLGVSSRGTRPLKHSTLHMCSCPQLGVAVRAESPIPQVVPSPPLAEMLQRASGGMLVREWLRLLVHLQDHLPSQLARRQADRPVEAAPVCSMRQHIVAD